VQESIHILGIAGSLRHESYNRAAIHLSADLGDPTTSDLFTEISRSLDKDLWFLEAHLQKKQ
jgi:starvation-inducible DNA-binding protein